MSIRETLSVIETLTDDPPLDISGIQAYAEPKLGFLDRFFSDPPGKGLQTMKSHTHKVQFDAHKSEKRPTEVSFVTRRGEEVDFVARKATKVPVHVSFRAKDKK